jgi:hypothetical protein
MQFKVEIVNLKEVQAALNKYPMIATKHIDKAVKSSIFEIERETKPRTPVDTGYLRESQIKTFGILKGIYEPIADYAVYVHEGTRRMKGRPFLKQGVEASTSRITDNFKRAVQDSLDEVARSA